MGHGEEKSTEEAGEGPELAGVGRGGVWEGGGVGKDQEEGFSSLLRTSRLTKVSRTCANSSKLTFPKTHSAVYVCLNLLRFHKQIHC